MPSFRIGYGSDFSIDSNGVGIGTTFAAANTKLDVVGALKGDFNITGVTTLTAYGGFVAQQQYVNKASTIGFATVSLGVGTASQYYETETGFTDLGGVHHGDDQRFNTLSEDLVIDDGQVLNITNTDMVGITTIGEYDPHNHSSYVCAGSLEQVSVTGHFSVPNGGSNDRESFIEGTVRFNTDLNTLEFFNGNEWRQFTYNQGQSGRAISGGGISPGNLDLIEYFSIATGGNATNFGNLTAVRNQVGGTSDGKRGIFAGGQPNTDIIDYITIASEGNAIDFGNLTVSRQDVQAIASSTRGIFGGGFTPSPNVAKNEIDYVEIQTTGNALDFGDLGSSGGWGMSAVQSPVRGVFLGGNPNRRQVIESITIASKGDAVNFGDCDNNTGLYSAGASNSVRGIFAGGSPAGKISYVTIASEGNTSVFGDLTTDMQAAAAAATQTRFTYYGGYGNASPNPTLNQISYVTIATLGDHQEFGELSIVNRLQAGFSDSHGGLGGF